MVALLLVAVSLGLSNFAAAIGIAVSGVDARTRLRVGLVFGLFEPAMPLLGLVLPVMARASCSCPGSDSASTTLPSASR
jgi:putative Mn2+ efflux pump MntP